jgi:cysteine sulfinate desulfinase/cysteine desulfurase-like protein
VLAAMGVDRPLLEGAIRVSIGPTTSENEIDTFLEAWRKLISSLSKNRRGLAA